MRILIICPSLPYPPDRGGSIRIFSFIKRLSQKNEIEIVSLDSGVTNKQDIVELEKYCKKVYIASKRNQPKVVQLPKILGRFIKGEPFRLKYIESKDLAKLLYKITSKGRYDIIQFEFSALAHNIKFLNTKHNPKLILSKHNISSLQYYRIYKTEKNVYKKMKLFLTWFPMLSWEPKTARLFDKLIVVSEMDKILLQFLEPMLDVCVVPNGVDTKMHNVYPLDGRKRNVLIVGSMDYEPNADAVKYFYNEIFPYIKRTIPESTLTIVGKNPPIEIQQLDKKPDVMVRGNVSDVRPYYSEALVSVVPLRAGGGTRLKILESMALGTPVVSTSLGCEGIEVKNRHNILIADNPKDFACKVSELMMSKKLWNEISHNARQLVEEIYDWDCITKKLENIYEDVVKGS